jgi:hypothetical protein
VAIAAPTGRGPAQAYPFVAVTTVLQPGTGAGAGTGGAGAGGAGAGGAGAEQALGALAGALGGLSLQSAGQAPAVAAAAAAAAQGGYCGGGGGHPLHGAAPELLLSAAFHSACSAARLPVFGLSQASTPWERSFLLSIAALITPGCPHEHKQQQRPALAGQGAALPLPQAAAQLAPARQLSQKQREILMRIAQRPLQQLGRGQAQPAASAGGQR